MARPGGLVAVNTRLLLSIAALELIRHAGLDPASSALKSSSAKDSFAPQTQRG